MKPIFARRGGSVENLLLRAGGNSAMLSTLHSVLCDPA